MARDVSRRFLDVADGSSGAEPWGYYLKLPEQLERRLSQPAGLWLVTGAAGFIGSNLLQSLLERGQRVRGLDDFATGRRANLDEVRAAVSPELWSGLEWIEGDIRDPGVCRRAMTGVDFVLHQAALASVPQSLEDPVTSHAVNVDGTVHLLAAAREVGVKRFVYASSCAVYGDRTDFPLQEPGIGTLLSPYALAKYVCECYAQTFARCYGLSAIGLRYFNVFGPRQDPKGAYAAVLPKWMLALIRNEPVYINGDGETTRDFCFVGDVVQANLLAALSGQPDAFNLVYNVGLGRQTSLNELYSLLRARLTGANPRLRDHKPEHRPFRSGDVRHSQADITLAGKRLGYTPFYSLEEGIEETVAYCLSHQG
jgi:UDP-N-acetylglucosamine/UDP-N-acetyl-alpha-D-glucosaminouronate 4-epimerase